MGKWVTVVTNPLGLAGFALFLVFSTLGRLTKRKRFLWASPAAFVLALIALVGGLYLSYRRISSSSSSVTPPNTQQIGTIQQQNQGSKDVNVGGVQGNVTVDIDSESHDKKSAETPEKKK